MHARIEVIQEWASIVVLDVLRPLQVHVSLHETRLQRPVSSIVIQIFSRQPPPSPPVAPLRWGARSAASLATPGPSGGSNGSPALQFPQCEPLTAQPGGYAPAEEVCAKTGPGPTLRAPSIRKGCSGEAQGTRTPAGVVWGLPPASPPERRTEQPHPSPGPPLPSAGTTPSLLMPTSWWRSAAAA